MSSKPLGKFGVKTGWDDADPQRPAGSEQPFKVVSPDGVVERSFASGLVDERFIPASAREPSLEDVDRIRRLVGVSVVEDETKLKAIWFSMQAVRQQTSKVVRSGVQIGREMLAVLKVLSEDEGRKVLKSATELFPGWSGGTLTKLMGAATFFDSGIVSEDVLPQSYTVLYELSKLPKSMLQRAVERQIIRPDLSKRAVGEIPKAIGMELASATLLSDRPAVASVHPEVAALDKEIKELQAKLSTTRTRRRRLVKKLELGQGDYGRS